MLTEYTAPGESVEVGDDESIYSCLPDASRALARIP